MRLSDLLLYREMVIQCHNYPDADAISSGYGLYLYYVSHGLKVRLVYSGKEAIKKSNLKIMISELEIPLEYVSRLEKIPEILITVDSQYGEGNITELQAQHIAVVDHHIDCRHSAEYSEIRDTYGSCATLVYMMLQEEEYPVRLDSRLMTALYYGLYMDTNAFSELKHPYDMDLIEELTPDETLILKLKNSNFTFQELEIAAGALNRCAYNEPMKFTIAKANPCDPNLLGFISDLVLQVDGVETSLAYCEQDYGYKFSIRNCNPQTTACEIVQYLIRNMGTGGGHKNKAGGYIIRKVFEENYAGTSLLEYLLNSMRSYFTSYDIIDLSNQIIDVNQLDLYERAPVLFGACNSTVLGKAGDRMIIRTISRDMEIETDPDLFLLLNIQGELFQMNRERFEQNYRTVGEEYECKMDYKPHVRRADGKMRPVVLTDYMNCCISVHKPRVFAKELAKTTKFYQNCDDKEYMLGEAGDFMVIKVDGEFEVSIIKHRQFQTDYHRITDEV